MFVSHANGRWFESTRDYFESTWACEFRVQASSCTCWRCSSREERRSLYGRTEWVRVPSPQFLVLLRRSSVEERRIHNPVVAGSIPAAAIGWKKAVGGEQEYDATVAQLGRGSGLRNRSVQVRILPVVFWGDSSIGRAFGLQPRDDGFESLSLHCDRGVTQTQEVVILPMRVELPSVTPYPWAGCSSVWRSAAPGMRRPLVRFQPA